MHSDALVEWLKIDFFHARNPRLLEIAQKADSDWRTPEPSHKYCLRSVVLVAHSTTPLYLQIQLNHIMSFVINCSASLTPLLDNFSSMHWYTDYRYSSHFHLASPIYFGLCVRLIDGEPSQININQFLPTTYAIFMPL